MDKTFLYRVTEKNFLTARHLQLIITPDSNKLTYEAGQYLEICYPSDHFYPFSIANAPDASGAIELHIKISPTDQETVEFVEKTHPRSQIQIRGPFGECQYQQSDANKLLILAAGTGFAPAKAIIEKLITTKTSTECHLYWTVKQVTDLYLPELPDLWKSQLTNFHFTPVNTQEDIASPKHNILEHVLDDFKTYSDCQVYVFGPQNLAIDTLQQLHIKGMKIENFFTDMLSRNSFQELVGEGQHNL